MFISLLLLVLPAKLPLVSEFPPLIQASMMFFGGFCQFESRKGKKGAVRLYEANYINCDCEIRSSLIDYCGCKELVFWWKLCQETIDGFGLVGTILVH